MNRKFSGVLAGSLGAFLFGAVLMAQAQNPPPPPPPPDADFLGVEMGGGHSVVKGAPFSGQTSLETTQTLADGTNISRKNTGMVYRDSEGRTRREQSLSGIGPMAVGHSGQFVMIHDTVAGKHYILDPEAKTAKAMPAHGGRGDKGGPDAVPGERHEHEKGDSANVTKESLGTQTIAGVAATGTRITRTIAAGEIGNDKPIQIVTERWYSNDLQTMVLVKHSDPRWGTTTYQLTNISRTEPAAGLFQVPADYTVKQGRGGHGHRRGFGGPPPAGGPDAPPAAPVLRLRLRDSCCRCGCGILL